MHVFVFIYTQYTHIYYENKNFYFWMRLIAINRLTALDFNKTIINLIRYYVPFSIRYGYIIYIVLSKLHDEIYWKRHIVDFVLRWSQQD